MRSYNIQRKTTDADCECECGWELFLQDDEIEVDFGVWQEKLYYHENFGACKSFANAHAEKHGNPKPYLL